MVQISCWWSLNLINIYLFLGLFITCNIITSSLHLTLNANNSVLIVYLHLILKNENNNLYKRIVDFVFL